MRNNYQSPSVKVLTLNVRHDICDLVPIAASLASEDDQTPDEK